MGFVIGESAHHHRRLFGAVFSSLIMGALTVTACSFPDATEDMKKVLSEHGSIDAEWQIRDEENQKTYTYVLLRNKSGTHETYEIIATDRQQTVQREQIGGIDANGCFLTAQALTTRWIMERAPELVEEAPPGGAKIQTACLEYQDTPAWSFVPEEDRKAAEPPPPPPETPATDADAGTTAEPEPDAGSVESAFP